MPAVSIVIPVYNTAKYLERCLNSVFAQTFSDIEVLIVNDGSTDNSKEICEKLIGGRINYFLLTKENGGLSSARLFGLQHAVGEYVVFIDSDDYLENTYVDKLYRAIVDSRADVSICSYYVVDGDKKTAFLLPKGYGSHLANQESILKYTFDQLPSLTGGAEGFPSYVWMRMFRRDLLKESFFISEDKVFLEDLVFNVLLSSFTTRIAVVSEPLYNYCVNMGSLTLRFRKDIFSKFVNLSNVIEKQLLMYEDAFSVHLRMNEMRVIWTEYSLANDAQSSYSYFRKEFYLIKQYVKKWDLKWTKFQNLLSVVIYFCISLKLSFLLYILISLKIRLREVFYKFK